MRFTTALALAAAVLAAGCSQSPTSPAQAQSLPVPVTPAIPPRVDGPFEITGVVTDEESAPVAGAEVAMMYYVPSDLGQRLGRTTTRTGGDGRYAISFSIDPSRVGLFARAEVIAEGHDWHRRTINDPERRRFENFRLRRIKRIAAGETLVVSVSRDNGDCFGWLYGPCGRLRVIASTAGDLTIEAVPTVNGAGLPVLETSGEQWGNPLTFHVNAGSETWVEIGQLSSSAPPSPTVLLKTSFKPD